MPPLRSPAAPTLAELRRLTDSVGLGTGHGAGPEIVPTMPFGVAGLDAALPGGGLALGALHQIHEGGPRGRYAATAVLFAGGILARLDGPVLWCLHSRDLFAPALARADRPRGSGAAPRAPARRRAGRHRARRSRRAG